MENSAKDAAGDEVGDVIIDDKIRDQMGERGWTDQDIQDAAKGPPTGTSTDNTEGRNEPATVYGSPEEHVIVNDANRKVVQISDRTKVWRPDSRIKWGR